MDIQSWFALDAPHELSEVFKGITDIYLAAQTAVHCDSASRQIELRLDQVVVVAEWFAASMYLEALRERGRTGIHWVRPQDRS